MPEKHRYVNGPDGERIPGYLAPTRCQSKTHRNLEEESVMKAFSPGNYQTLRSLPKIKPGFKPSPNTQRAYLNRTGPRGADEHMTNDELWELHHEDELVKFQQLQSKTWNVKKTGRGQNAPSLYSPRAHKCFSDFEYIPSEFDREKVLKAAEARKARERNVCVEDFKNFSMPEVIAGVGTFREFEYTTEPYETRDVLASIEQRDKANMQIGPHWKPGGARGTSQFDAMRGRLEEAINVMAAKLVKDWPTVLRGLEIVNEGYIVVAFDTKTKQTEGNAAVMKADASEFHSLPEGRKHLHDPIRRYMRNFMKTDDTVLTCGLRVDASRWPDESDPNYLLFVMRPPWVHERPEHVLYAIRPQDATFSPKSFRRNNAK